MESRRAVEFELSRRRFFAAAAGLAGAWALSGLARGEPPAAKPTVDDAVGRGLDWLKRNQQQDGHWEASAGAYKTAMTGLAGMALLMEGSTLKEGKYTDQIKKAVEWLTAPARLQPNGLIADRGAGGEFDNYMHGHGYATMFLACAYGEAEDADEQVKLEKALKRAIEFTCKAQTNRKHKMPEGKEMPIGGWGYVSAADGQNFDEGSVTITALQALRAAKNAAIQVPKENIDKAVNYLEACTTPKGGIIYSYTNSGGAALSGQERPPLTAAAICCGFSAGQYTGELPKKWIKFCKDNILIAKGRVPHDEYLNYYFAQFVYALGDERYGRMFPNEPKESWLTWSKYREVMYPYLIDQQAKDGMWMSGYVGPVFATAVNLAILQLEKGLLPIYQR
jgi:hypothetical protein